MTHSKVSVLVLAAIMLGACLLCTTPIRASKDETPKEAAPSSASEDQRNREVRMKLEEVHALLELTGREFEDAVEYLRQLNGLNLYVNWEMLERVGVDRTKEVNLRLQDVTTQKVLEVILDDVGEGNDLGYVIDRGVITISSKEDLSKYTTTRVYDVSHLIDWADIEEVNSLVEVVTNTIAPESWAPGGTGGSITHLKGAIVVTQTYENHEALKNLLSELGETVSNRKPSPKARVKQAGLQIKMMGTWKEACFNPSAMSIMALVALRDEVPREPAEVIAELEETLAKTKNVGLRSALRLTLKDLYKAQGNDEKVLEHLRGMLGENRALIE